MPAGRQGPPQGQNDGGASGARDQIRDIGHHLQEGAQQLGQRVQEGYDTARTGVTRGYHQAEGTIERNPAPSILIGFGIGVGLGLLLTTLVAQREESWYDRYVPDSLRNLHESFSHLPEAISRRLPDSLRR